MFGLKSLTASPLVMVVVFTAIEVQAGLKAAEIDLSHAVVVVPDGLSSTESKAVQVLVEEVRRRSRIGWDTMIRWPTSQCACHRGRPRLGCSTRSRKSIGNSCHPSLLARNKKDSASRPSVGPIPRRSWRLSATMPAACFSASAGLLRELRMAPGHVALPESLNLASAPKYPLRGHQLGYRPKTNSYDAWDLAQWDRYIRDLAIFGTNAIELIPPRSDDAADSPHFPLPPLEMMAGMSQICADYGLDVWIWYPAMDADYADPKTVEHALAEWARGVQEAAADRCRLCAGRRPGAHAPRSADGTPGKAGREPAPVSSQGADVGLAPELLAGVARRIPQAHVKPSPPGWPASCSARKCA